jgi:hypothetical protein
MKPFTYQYTGQIFQSAVDHYMDGINHRYRVQIGEIYSVIVPSGFPGPDNSIVWVQSHKADEPVLKHELVQAIGEGLEKSGIEIHRTPAAI